MTFLGSSGIHVLLDSHHEAAKCGSRIAVVADQNVVLRSLGITAVDRVCGLNPNLSAALNAGVRLRACGPGRSGTARDRNSATGNASRRSGRWFRWRRRWSPST
ncbi:STAS domain-containing protein [Lentzea miocenica]|uniref:hypothetical protein n=1 Tax=Lentzea miocenica TaxID=3095431 RepID=UPI003873CC53